jgi:hypothetical protein
MNWWSLSGKQVLAHPAIGGRPSAGAASGRRSTVRSGAGLAGNAGVVSKERHLFLSLIKPSLHVDKRFNQQAYALLPKAQTGALYGTASIKPSADTVSR